MPIVPAADQHRAILAGVQAVRLATLPACRLDPTPVTYAHKRPEPAENGTTSSSRT